MAAFEMLGIDSCFAGRSLNDGFSGGEKKRIEILQMAMLKPRWPCSTRPTPASTSTRSGRSRTVSIRSAGPRLGVLLVTHYQRLLNYVKPDRVHVLMDGRIVESGGPELVDKLEELGYDWIEKGANSAPAEHARRSREGDGRSCRDVPSEQPPRVARMRLAIAFKAQTVAA